jgi:hypothetical protein
MATSAYISGRKRYQRPQSILWSENAGTLSNGLYVPTGQEIGANSSLTTGGINQFLILSDHNREDMSFNSERIEKRERTINGRMRSYHIADKLTMNVSWNNLPSRAYSDKADFASTGLSPNKGTSSEFTADGGAGGVEVLDWYENHQGPFWMYLAYDKYTNFPVDGETTDASFGHLGKYNQIVEVYFSDFNYSVVKRGGTNHDLWNISVSLEEV